MKRDIKIIGLAYLAGVWALTSATAWAQDNPPGNGETTTIQLEVGHSKVIKSPWPAKRVSVTDPGVADVQVLTPTRVLLMGKAVGATDLIMWSEQEDVRQARVVVRVDLSLVREQLVSLFPGAAIQISQSRDVIVVSGSLARAEQAEQLRRYMDATGLNYVDMTRVTGVHQVEIRVRVAEASRTAIRALGIQTLNTGTQDNDFFGSIQVGPSNGGALTPINIGPPQGVGAGPQDVPFVFNSAVNVSPLVTLFGGFPRADLEFFLEALVENLYVKILAEPNLVALSGEEAHFLAGGEFPIPVVQGGIGGGSLSVTVEYKKFGVQLSFRPIVLGDGTIRLHVATEVSELSDLGAVIVQGFRIPSVITRQVETTIELHSGQTFGMAGLIKKTDGGRSSRFPGLGDLPILGALFRSVRYERGESELIVLVTANLIEPLSIDSDPPVPGDLHVPPDDWELFAEGQIHGKIDTQVFLPEPECFRELGFHRLRGPGAWARHGQPPAPSLANATPNLRDVTPQPTVIVTPSQGG